MHKLPLPLTANYHQISMRPLLFLSNAFINTFGITQPTPKNEARMAWFIASMLALVGVLVVAAATIILYGIYR